MHQISETTRRELLEAHGDFAIAYATAFQPDLMHFGDERGFLSYKMVGKTAFVAGNPLAPRDRWEDLIAAFIAARKDVTFWQTSNPLAAMLSKRGFVVNALGLETTVHLPSFTFGGPARRNFRTASNRIANRGRSVRELPVGQVDVAALQAISESWRAGKVTKNRELSFLARPVVLSEEPGVRKFFLLDPAGKPEAFAVFDPVFRDGKVIGYLSATRRWLATAEPLAAYAMVRAAIERFQAEGIETLHLGLSPFYNIEDREFEYNWFTRRSFKLMYRSDLANRFIYPVRSLAAHKASYGGTETMAYCAFNTLPTLPRLLKFARACRVV